MHRIAEGNSFELIIIGQKKTDGTVENIDLSPVDELAVYLVKAGRGRKLMAYTIDEAVGIVVSVDASEVSKGIYGVEVIGKIEDTAIHAQQPSAFQIVDGYHRSGDAGAVMSYEVYILMTYNTEENKRYIDAAVAAEADERRAADDALSDRIDNAGKVDDVKVNGLSVLNPLTKEANINIAASVVENDQPGNPTANATIKKGNIIIEFANIKGERGNGVKSVDDVVSGKDGGINTHTFTDTDGRTHVIHTRNGQTGRPGKDFQPIEDVSGLSIAHVLGDDETSVMSQKGVTLEINGIKEKIERVYDISDPVEYPDGLVPLNGSYASNTERNAAWHFPNDTSRAMRGKILRLYPQSDNIVRVAFMKNEPVLNRHAFFSGEQPAAIGDPNDPASINQIISVIVPKDTEYVLIYTRSINKNIRPIKIEVVSTLESKLNKEEDISRAQDKTFENLVKKDMCGMVAVAEVPKATETYNGYRTSGRDFNYSSKRLLWMPECYVKGGEDITIEYTGYNAIELCEFDFIPLGTGIINNDFDRNLLLKTKIFPQSTSPKYNRHITHKLLKNTRRICIWCGATQDEDVVPNDITLNIENVVLPTYDPTDINVATKEDVSDAFAEINERILQEYDTTDAGEFSDGRYIEGDAYLNPTNSNAGCYFDRGTSRDMRGKHIRLIPQDGKYVRVAFTKNEPVTNYAWLSVYEPNVIGSSDDVDKVRDIIVPKDVENVWFQTKHDGIDIRPAKIEVYIPLDEELSQLKIGQPPYTEENLVKDDMCGFVIKQEAPKVIDTYNANKVTADYVFNHITSRLLWLPEYYIKGGESVRIEYSAGYSIGFYELPFVELGTGVINNANVFDKRLLLKYTKLPRVTSGNGDATITLRTDTRRIALVIVPSPIREISPSEITEIITEATLPVYDLSDIKTGNGWNSVADDIYNMVRQSMWVANTPETPAFSLLHFSDVHGSERAVASVADWAHELRDYITDLLCTGDSVSTRPLENAHGSEWWRGCGLAGKSLFVVGNHDAATKNSSDIDETTGTPFDPIKEGSSYWDGKGQPWDFDTYFADFAEQWGVTMPEGYDDPTSPHYKACYWHKDYPAQKVRLIGLDCMHRFDGVVMPDDGRIVPFITADTQEPILDGNGDPITDEEQIPMVQDDPENPPHRIAYYSGLGLKRAYDAENRPVPNNQELWLIDRLNETTDPNNPAKGYAVIICCHYGLDDVEGHDERWDEETHRWVYNQNITPVGGTTPSGVETPSESEDSSENGNMQEGSESSENENSQEGNEDGADDTSAVNPDDSSQTNDNSAIGGVITPLVEITPGGAVMSYKTSAVVNFHSLRESGYAWGTSYNLRNRVANPAAVSGFGYDKGKVNNIGNIISAWIARNADKDNKANFVCWLAGHTHRDLFFYPNKFPELLTIVIDQAGNGKVWNTGDRTSGTDSAVCANLLVVDTQNSLIKIVRLGYSLDKALNSHRYLCYDYKNRKVINEG